MLYDVGLDVLCCNSVHGQCWRSYPSHNQTSVPKRKVVVNERSGGCSSTAIRCKSLKSCRSRCLFFGQIAVDVNESLASREHLLPMLCFAAISSCRLVVKHTAGRLTCEHLSRHDRWRKSKSTRPTSTHSSRHVQSVLVLLLNKV